MAQTDFVYEIVNGIEGVKFHDWTLKSTVTGDDGKQGRFVEQDSSEEAIKALDGVFTALTKQTGGRVRPIISGQEQPDSQETGLVTTVYGEHEAETNGYHADPTALTPARAAWAAQQALVVVDGKLAPFLDGTDKDYSIIGHLVTPPVNTGDLLRFHYDG